MSLTIGMLLFPKLTQLDLTGPYEVLARAPDSRIHLVWKDRSPIASDRGMGMVPDMSFADCPQLDLICVPGGPGHVALMEDDETLDFLRTQAAKARWVTSVCTGSLVLGAAGLLDGYRATSHWGSRERLSAFGAIPTDKRVVIDRNRITGGGVTSGIDFALTVIAELYGEDTARRIQLQIEYDPAPPFTGGSPQSAAPELVEAVLAGSTAYYALRDSAIERASAKLKKH
ncbi:DJ-1/PfpI family protein [Lacibacterium aquatile]|uniref:DJ-1/PfpI family protein n=1 Tax=Lacibacterium aquatile TaxID=1168082 RepID=A0ABW5DQ36_9PROT